MAGGLWRDLNATRLGSARERSPRVASARVDSVVNVRTATKVSRFLGQLPNVGASSVRRRACLPLGFVLMTSNRLSGLLLSRPPRNNFLRQCFRKPSDEIASDRLVRPVCGRHAGAGRHVLYPLTHCYRRMRRRKRLITELRRKVQENHVGGSRWPLRFK